MSNPFNRFAPREVELILQRIVLADLDFLAQLKLFQQNIRTALVVVKSNRTLEIKPFYSIFIFYFCSLVSALTVTPSKLVLRNASRKIFSQSASR